MSTNRVLPVKKIGLLGGGQLAAMLAEAAADLNLETTALISSREGPVGRRLSHVLLSADPSESDYETFANSADLILFENEFVKPSFLKLLAQKSSSLAVPKPEVMEQFANKLRQKQILENLDIPTTAYSVYDTQTSMRNWLKDLQKRFDDRCVLKWSQGGYDGKGNFVLNFKNLSSLHWYEAERFISAAVEQKVAVYAEEFTEFAFEFAILAARSINDSWCFLPSVITKQEEGVCAEVCGPATDFGLPEEANLLCQTMAKTLAENTGLYGMFAIEFFYTKDKRALVNEIAPRVHNSGHYSQDALYRSQFHRHLQAALGYDFYQESNAAEKRCPYFGMINVLGPPSFIGEVKALDLVADGVFTHWYEKDASRPGRKLGHVNVLAEAKSKLESKIAMIRSEIYLWQKSYNK